MGVINVLGIVSGVIGIWGFVEDMFPDPRADHSLFKVYVGLDQTANPSDPGECCLADAGGSIRYSKLFNLWGDDIGHGGMYDNLKSGSAETIAMLQSVPEQAPTVELFAGKDAICIAAIGATLVDGTKWGWVGDWGMICGLNWYYSGVKQSQWDDKSPMCTWIDADHSNGITAGGIAINWPGFIANVLPTDGGVGKCGTVFGAWDKEGGHSVINTTAHPLGEKHDEPNGRGLRDRRLVVSSLDAHSADELCRHPMSLGPSFVSLAERKICNMNTREVLPLCADDLTTGCFDLEAVSARAALEQTSSLAGAEAPAWNLTHIIYW